MADTPISPEQFLADIAKHADEEGKPTREVVGEILRLPSHKREELTRVVITEAVARRRATDSPSLTDAAIREALADPALEQLADGPGKRLLSWIAVTAGRYGASYSLVMRRED